MPALVFVAHRLKGGTLHFLQIGKRLIPFVALISAIKQRINCFVNQSSCSAHANPPLR